MDPLFKFYINFIKWEINNPKTLKMDFKFINDLELSESSKPKINKHNKLFQ